MNIPGFSKEVKQNRKKNIFINYRVHDTAGETGRLVDRLKQHFSDDQIFMDIDKIEPGLDFTKAISKSLESCDIMLAIIGPHWLGVNPADNTSRIRNPNDWVKTEISTALQRDIRVVPVLVNGGQLPDAADLPQELQPLLLRQSYEISNKRWDYDTEQLINVLIKSGITPKPPIPVPPVGDKTWWKKNSWWVYILIGIIITVSVLVNIADEKNRSNSLDPGNDVNNNQVQQQSEPQQKDPQQNLVDDSPPANTSSVNVDGNWSINDNGVIYTYDIVQNGSNLNIEIYVSNQVIGSGYGYNYSGDIELYLNIGGVSTVAKGRLSPDGKNISGKYTLQATGQIGQFSLMRQL
ncbi:MAG: toll/interleukin-1 receptor domain-containing protein [Bacteroidota bacterium]|nr:toll/interleukin-1 receptor domain-containing protein [Bacteroidota bacterium]